MREIKFKSYIKDKNGKITFCIFNPFNPDSESQKIIEPDSELLAYGLQFTGLKYKNGKEIFEGDKITFSLEVKTSDIYRTNPNMPNQGYWNQDGFKGIISWNEKGSWEISDIKFEKGLTDSKWVEEMNEREKATLDYYFLIKKLDIWKVSNIQVAGNIYEHANLLQ